MTIFLIAGLVLWGCLGGLAFLQGQPLFHSITFGNFLRLGWRDSYLGFYHTFWFGPVGFVWRKK